MERSPKYTFDKKQWKPSLDADGRPSCPSLVDSLNESITTWRQNTNKANFNVLQRITSLLEILQATAQRDGLQELEWWKSRTDEEKRKFGEAYYGTRVR